MKLSLLHSTVALPKASKEDEAQRLAAMLEQWIKGHPGEDAQILENILHHAKELLDAVGGNSPYLSQLIIRLPEWFALICKDGADRAWEQWQKDFAALPDFAAPDAEWMKHLRFFKAKAALLIALADITENWQLSQITAALSDTADSTLQAVTNLVLMRAHLKKEIELTDLQNPSFNSGLIVLGMGKLGARELNYSSDVDVIILFDREKMRYTGRNTLQHCCSKMAQELVRLMQERTQDGYIFRTDLRLRPDPASTPPAIAVAGAITYYETVGQNWERAALIKARPVAGDIVAGESFLQDIAPFIWRKHLDFAAIADIQSIKRQMDSRAQRQIAIPGHNVKLGLGGIREIEFYAQIHQLIWGGRMPEMRRRATCDTLRQMVDSLQVPPATVEPLIQAYALLRKVEHRIQMIHDEQTHSLPKDSRDIESLALFLGYDNVDAFSAELLAALNTVHGIFSTSFKGTEELGSEGNLVFTGVEHDPETLETIGNMGFHSPATVSEVIQAWHRGSRRATRTKRARELITELTPALLEAFASTANPDAAFLKFDEFLNLLPAGVQLFSLFNMNRPLLTLIATIMGSAPALADHLSKYPHLLDTVLTARFYASLPEPETLAKELDAQLQSMHDLEETLNLLRRFKNEKEFQAGVQLLTRRVAARDLGAFLSSLAELLLDRLIKRIQQEFEHQYGQMPYGNFSVLALGKLGARELTFGSDLDLVFVYDTQFEEQRSTGSKDLSASAYYNRLAQRYIGGLTALMKEGMLYEVDTRLRPSGRDGPLAVSVAAFDKYFTESAWSFEFMALTRARPIATDKIFTAKLEPIIKKHLCAERNIQKLTEDVLDIRRRVNAEFGSLNPWDVKYVRGGTMDVDFLAQYLTLRHAHARPDVLASDAVTAFGKLAAAHILPAEQAAILTQHTVFLQEMLCYLRLCSHSILEPSTAPEGLKRLLTAAFCAETFTKLESMLVKTEREVYDAFSRIIGPDNALDI